MNKLEFEKTLQFRMGVYILYQSQAVFGEIDSSSIANLCYFTTAEAVKILKDMGIDLDNITGKQKESLAKNEVRLRDE